MIMFISIVDFSMLICRIFIPHFSLILPLLPHPPALAPLCLLCGYHQKALKCARICHFVHACIDNRRNYSNAFTSKRVVANKSYSVPFGCSSISPSCSSSLNASNSPLLSLSFNIQLIYSCITYLMPILHTSLADLVHLIFQQQQLFFKQQ